MPRPAAKLAAIARLSVKELSDAELIAHHLRGDAGAMEVLVRRHGPVVLGVCRRLLGTSADADDAFQATFVTLSLRAQSIRDPNLLNGWLHGVALRCCRKAMSKRARGSIGDVAGRADPFAEVSWRELRGLLDEELNRLPMILRAPLILCHLENQTRDEAARSLGWSLRTLDRRLAKGRELLKGRLVRRGVGALGLGLAVFESDSLTASVSPRLLSLACQSRTAVSPAVRSLVIPAAGGVQFKLAASLVFVLGGLVAAVAGYGGTPQVEKKAEAPASTIATGDELEEPLPDGALRRFGTTRFRYPAICAHAAMSRDGKRVAIGGYGLIIVYDTETGKPLHTFHGCGMTNGVARLPAIAFSPDGKLLAHIVRDGEFAARVWNLETGKQVSAVTRARDRSIEYAHYTGFHIPQEDWVGLDHSTGIHFTDDGKRIAIVGERQVHVRDTLTGAKVSVHDIPAIMVTGQANGQTPATSTPVQATIVAFSPDGKLYVSNNGAEWQVGELATKKVLFRTKVERVKTGERYPPEPFAAISGDHKLVAIPTERLDGVMLWDIASNRLVSTLASDDPKIKLIDHLAFSADDKCVFASGEDVVYRWQTSTGKMLPPLKGSAGYGKLRTFTDSNGQSLVTVDANGKIDRWDQSTGGPLPLPSGYAPYTMTDLSANDDHVVVADGSGQIDLWTMRDNQRHELRRSAWPRTRDVRFSPNGKLLAAGFSDGTIRVWETATRSLIKRFQVNPNKEESPVEGLAWSPDDSCLYATTPLNGVVAWKWRTNELLWRTPIVQATKICTSNDGKLVAALRVEDWEIPILDAATGKVRTTVRKPAGKDRYSAPECIVFSPDGRSLLAGHYDGLLRRWDTTTGAERASFASDGDVMWGIDVSRDGQYAVTGSSNGTVRVWELDTGKEVFRRVESKSSSLRVKFSRDCRTVLSAQQRAPILWSVVGHPTADQQQHWSDLTSEPAAAHRALWGLANSKDLAAFLRTKVGGKVPASEEKRIAQLIADLDSPSFRGREAAANELIRLGRLAESAVRKALAKPASEEQRQRLERLIGQYGTEFSNDQLRIHRAVQALAWSRDPNASKLLSEWAAGMDGAPLTIAARRAIEAAR